VLQNRMGAARNGTREARVVSAHLPGSSALHTSCVSLTGGSLPSFFLQISVLISVPTLECKLHENRDFVFMFILDPWQSEQLLGDSICSINSC
jgi:hypothetical protein